MAFLLKNFEGFFCRGINVLNTKSELEKAFAKHKKNLNEKKKEQESAESFTGEFQKMIAERARRLEKVHIMVVKRENNWLEIINIGLFFFSSNFAVWRKTGRGTFKAAKRDSKCLRMSWCQKMQSDLAVQTISSSD